MKLATTTCDFDRYTEGYLPKIKEVSAAGFRYIDLSLYTVEPDDELMLSTDWETHLDAIAAYARFSGTALPRPVDLKANDAGSVADVQATGEVV